MHDLLEEIVIYGRLKKAWNKDPGGGHIQISWVRCRHHDCDEEESSIPLFHGPYIYGHYTTDRNEKKKKLLGHSLRNAYGIHSFLELLGLATR